VRVVIYTGHLQSEQGIVISDVTALTVVADDLLTIEAEVTEGGHRHFGHHRFVAGEWTHFSVQA
jgi:hypothetical protein